MAITLFDKQYILYDGGMGTMLMKNGLKPNQRSDIMNIEHPDIVEKIHAEYVSCGSEIICTNTFSLSSVPDDVDTSDIISAAVIIAKKASAGRALVAIDIGPIGDFFYPYGGLTYDIAFNRFKHIATIAKASGADLASVETMSTIDELKAAVDASVYCGFDTLATMTFNKTGKTFAGCSVEEFADYINNSEVKAAGFNCSLSPDEMFPLAKKLSSLINKPLIMKLNAGLPAANGKYSVSPQEFADQMLKYKEINVRIIGGCCGTTPEYIKCLSEVFV